MKKIGFVTPWYGENIPGGAETELRGIVVHLHAAGVELEVLTTCVREFASDWNTDYHRPGLTREGGIPVRRFKVRRRDTAAFDAVNLKLIKGIAVSRQEEETFLREMVNSPALYDYLRDHRDEYALYVFIPYLFGTTYYGACVCPEKSVLIPCLHEESYAHLKSFGELFAKLRGMLFLSAPEHRLAEQLYDLSRVKTDVPGAGVDTETTGDPARFVQKYGISEPFILYAGRKDTGKNVDLLLRYFGEYKKRRQTPVKLLLLGGGSLQIPPGLQNDVRDLGFVPFQDKHDAYAAASLLCQPSAHESFSIVIMESWLNGRPVLVNGDCAVTRDFAVTAGAGLYFGDYFEFEGCVDYLLGHPEISARMGGFGRRYVLGHFAWPVIVKKYTEFFTRVSEG